jgi:branched-chain amino acid aminotransferase
MYYQSDTIVFCDGKFIPVGEMQIDPFTQTLHYGNGVFDGMRSFDTPEGLQIFKAVAHYKRFAQAAKGIRLSLDYSAEQLEDISYELLKRNGLKDAYIRPLLYADVNMALASEPASHLMIATWKWGRLLGNNLVNLMTSSYRRISAHASLADAKVCGHYINSILATNEARSKQFHDAVLLDEDGYVACASGANIFIEIDDVLYTPAPGHIVPGITRATVMELAAEVGTEVVEKKITLEELREADGAFLAGTAVELAGIATLDRQGFKMRWEDTIGFMLSRKYRQLVTQGHHHQGTLI